MKYRPSLAFLACLLPMIACGAAAGWAWWKLSSVPPQVLAKAGFFETLAYRPPPPPPPAPTTEQLARAREAARKMVAQLLAEFPGLAIENHPVPDDQNGFLQFHLLHPPPIRQDRLPCLPAETIGRWPAP